MASPYTFTTAIDHTTTAGFRTWGAEFSGALATIGLVQTADSGQINWSTVTLPGDSTLGGYEIWRFADSTLYMKFEYGTGTSARPNLFITVGTGSNGSGTLTGTNQISTRVSFAVNQNAASTTATYPSYFSRTANHLAILWKTTSNNGGTACLAALVIGKTVDGTGAATVTGYALLSSNSGGTVNLQSVRIAATAAVYPASAKFCVIPGEPASSLDASGNYQCYMCYMNVPDALPFMWASAVNSNDIPRGTTFTVAQVGSSARTYLSMGNISGFSTGNVNNHAAPYYFAMLYE